MEKKIRILVAKPGLDGHDRGTKVETLSKQMEEKILEGMKRIDEIGGMVKAVETGHVQREVAKQAYEFEKGVQKGGVDQGRSEQIC